jgi:hypothetical protein
MPLSAEEFYTNAMEIADDEGRMPLSRVTGWDIFPFEPEGLRVDPLRAPEVPEAPRRGENGGGRCGNCDGTLGGVVWHDDNWRLITFGDSSGAPLVMMLIPSDHFDLINLPDELAAQLGRLIVHTARAIESLEHVARAHVSRWGDGGAHLHVFFFARPEGFEQLRGTCFAVWDDLLNPVPQAMRDADAREVARTLAGSYGGVAL